MHAKISASVKNSTRLVSTGLDSVSRRIVCIWVQRLESHSIYVISWREETFQAHCMAPTIGQDMLSQKASGERGSSCTALASCMEWQLSACLACTKENLPLIPGALG